MRLILYNFLLLLLLTQTVMAVETDWTEKKLGKVTIKAERAARLQKWTLAINYGEKTLEGYAALYEQSDAKYIGQLQNINRYYDKAGRLPEVPERVKKGYELATINLGSSHVTTMMSRILYYKLNIINNDYKRAIPLVLEDISLVGKGEQEDYRKLHYLKQLYSLYGLSAQYEKEEEVLLQYLELNSRWFGNEDEDSNLVIKMLAQNHCRRKLHDKFRNLIEKYGLRYVCN